MRKREIFLWIVILIPVIILSFFLSDKMAFHKKDKSKEEQTYQGKKNETITEESKWVNSEMEGAIDENLQAELKDDFYSYINKEWALNNKTTEDGSSVGSLVDNYTVVKDRMISIVSGKEDPEANKTSSIGLDQAEIDHDEEIMAQFTQAVMDWDGRNEKGVSSLKGYIDAIESISNMEEMSEYICDLTGDNISGDGFFVAGVDASGTYNKKQNKTLLLPSSTYALLDETAYLNSNSSSVKSKQAIEKEITLIMSKLGYSDAQISTILRQNYETEAGIIDHKDETSATRSEGYLKQFKKSKTTFEELDGLVGDYPLKEFFTNMGYDAKGEILFYQTSYADFIKEFYNQSNLEKIKSYYIVHTVLFAAPLLDKETYECHKEINEIMVGGKKSKNDGEGDTKEKTEKDQWDEVFNNYIDTYLTEPLQIVYVSRYCSQEQKEELTQLVERLLKEYKVLLSEADWLSESARKGAQEKIDCMKIKVLYPDTFNSYMDLEFESDDLLKMVQQINMKKAAIDASFAGKPYDAKLWDLNSCPTTTVNAFYSPNTNSINLLAGILANGDMYHTGSTEEELLAGTGFVLGHEITHGFDTTGAKFDKYGNEKAWMDFLDQAQFTTRADKLQKYYSSLAYYRDGNNLSGFIVSGEAIADLGSMKVCLRLAKEKKDFDYDFFYRTIATNWRQLDTFEKVNNSFYPDEHPMNFLRVNISCMQYDEFYETYGIKKGDGMYMDPKERITVW